jgi:dTMP kinase
MARGKFITLEGPEGSGKTTQSAALVKRLEAEGLDVVVTREPGGTPTGELIRDILQHDKAGEPICPPAEVFLFAASRAQHVYHVILPALEAGKWVICDRFIDSTTAYQGYGREIPVERLQSINEFAIGPAIPDCTLLFDIEVEAAMERLQQRLGETGGTPDRIEQESLDFHKRVRKGYLNLAAAEPNRFHIVDASRTPEEIEQSVWDHMTQLGVC